MVKLVMYRSIDIASYFIEKIDQPTTPMQILKLTYIAQGFYLALKSNRLFEEEITAWRYGPVIESLYRELKSQCTDSLINKNKLKPTTNLSDEVKNILDVILKKYGKLNGWQLSDLTHKAGSPWHKVFYNDDENKVITIQNIEEYFKTIINETYFDSLLRSLKLNR